MDQSAFVAAANQAQASARNNRLVGDAFDANRISAAKPGLDRRKRPLFPDGSRHHHPETTMQNPTQTDYRPIDVAHKLSLLQEQWQPRVVAEMNDYQFKIAKLQGDFVWHHHPDTDETFIV